MLTAINPATGDLLNEYEEITPDQVSGRLEKAQQAFEVWRQTSFSERAALMKATSRILTENKNAYARTMALEMGKPIKSGRAEIEKCAWVCEFYAEHAEEMLKPEIVQTDAHKSYVTYNPLGVILAVMPWNYPFWQVFRHAAPGLMAGNGVVLKHASNVPGCSMAIADIIKKAGFPENLFQNFLMAGRRTDRIIEHPVIRAVTLTGSKAAGRAVAAQAGKLLKKTVLELGGSDPYIILEDADLAETIETCVASRLLNSGQSCIAAKRFVVVESVHKQFVELFVEKMRSQKMGDPLDETVDIGPQARADLRDDLHRQVIQSIEKGANCLLGGEIPQSEGAFYPATVLSEVTKGMPAFDEETFGPVAAVIPVKHERQAVEVANDSAFGLGAAIFTRDRHRGEHIAANELEAGNCFVNAFVKSDPRLPFGGVKESGFGRELSHYGLREFVNIKTVYVH
ncbi:MAG: NAD-dependent succinate-semialdehyde dehydrogenase [Desulfobacterales bacterium]|jgi:succinate-semialdehyde dehydrogenase/glutarate-semialdehyde dehydrogenase